MKNYRLLFLMLLFSFGLSSCFDSCCPDPTKEECEALHPCPVCPEIPPSDDCGTCTVTTMTKDEAQTLINNAQAHISTFKWGVAVDPCKMCQISQANQKVYINVGLMADNTTAVLIAKYIFPSGLDSAYSDVTATAPPGEPLCPPGTRCN